jgi:hypothetical protein
MNIVGLIDITFTPYKNWRGISVGATVAIRISNIFAHHETT